MNCATVKAWLRERFDQGLPLEEGFETHLESCDTCRAYVERLRALESSFADLPVEAPSPGFEDALVAHVRGQGRPSTMAWGVGLVAFVSVVLILVGWRVPVVAYVDSWLTQVARWQPDFSLSLGLFMPFLEWGREAWAAVALPEFLGAVQSPWISGVSIASLAIVLVAFNAAIHRASGRTDSGSDSHAR
ncbi:MAG: hypothetical protein KJ060_03625 [Candidatus Hydrogenedentes bacterium]|nr:hypothetical protein [Candidatus Hydrogenedentota bacterium]